MKKKFYWKSFIKKMGKMNFVGFIISIILTIIGTILVFKEFGFKLVFESFALSFLFDKIKDFRKAIKETNDEYTIEQK